MNQIDTLCIAGGGIKGFSFISALNILIQHNYIDLKLINKLSGTSFGSIFCFFLTIGYTPYELIVYFNNLNKKELFVEPNSELFFSEFGLTDAENYMSLIKTLFYLKIKLTEINFIDLHTLTNKELIIIGTNYTLGSREIFSYKTTPLMSVLTAIRISIAIPLLMTPVKYNGYYYVDGCLTSNLGIDLCDPSKTLCICLQKPKQFYYDDLTNIINGLISIGMITIQKPPDNFKTMEIVQHNCNHVINGDESFFKNAFDCGTKSGLKFLKKEYLTKIKIIQLHIDSIINESNEHNICYINSEPTINGDTNNEVIDTNNDTNNEVIDTNNNELIDTNENTNQLNLIINNTIKEYLEEIIDVISVKISKVD